MQTDKNYRKVKKSISMHSYAFKQSHKCQKVIDTKLCNASHMLNLPSVIFSSNVSKVNTQNSITQLHYKKALQKFWCHSTKSGKQSG